MFGVLKRIFLHPLQSIRHPGSIFQPTTWCNEAFISYLRSKGAVIGEGTRFISPSRCSIDPGRLDYIKIGNNCCLSVVSILAHDYSWYTFLESQNDILPDAGGEVIIGNNCFIGYEALILKDTRIGDNVIIGARSVVKGNIPSNTVWAGVPARQICSIDDLYRKRADNRISDALLRRNHIKEKKHRNPEESEMGLFSLLFLERTNENYSKYLKDQDFNGIKNSPLLRQYFFSSTPVFSSFEQFLNI